MGAVQVHLKEVGLALQLTVKSDYAHCEDFLRRQLGEDAFTALYDEDLAMTWEKVLEAVLSG
jgi:hypothetical protein